MTTAAALRASCLALLSDWIRIPSVAGDPASLRRMAATLAAYLRDRLGARGRTCAT